LLKCQLFNDLAIWKKATSFLHVGLFKPGTTKFTVRMTHSHYIIDETGSPKLSIDINNLGFPLAAVKLRMLALGITVPSSRSTVSPPDGWSTESDLPSPKC
jgi:hypothetical protein